VKAAPPLTPWQIARLTALFDYRTDRLISDHEE
jgi:hypothetical protein